MMTKKITRFALLLIVLCTSAFAQSNDVNLLLSTLPAGKDPQRYKGYVEPQFKAVTQRSLYLAMRDGVKIAVTVILPKDLPADRIALKKTRSFSLTRPSRSQQTSRSRDIRSSVCSLLQRTRMARSLFTLKTSTRIGKSHT